MVAELRPHSGCHPVLPTQPGRALEVTHVVRHQCQLVGDGLGGDLGVDVASRCVVALVVGLDGAKAIGSFNRPGQVRQPLRKGIEQGAYTLQGSITSIPQSAKSRTLRVASRAPRERVMAAIIASKGLMGLPKPFLAAAISA